MAETIDLGIVGIKNMGVYNSQTAYEKLNVVTYEGSTYCALKDTVGNLPTNTDYWQLYAQKGGKGDTGDTGPQGPAPVRGVDYYTASDKQEIEDDLADDIAAEVSSSLGSLTTATPLVASSVSGMVDTTRVYVNSADGHWYWYDGEDWQDGGIYQATVAPYDTTLTVKDGVADSKSIGDRINKDYFKCSILNTNNMLSNKIYQNDGTITDYTGWYIFKDVLHAKNGDTVRLQYLHDNGDFDIGYFGYIIKTDEYGNFISLTSINGQSKYTFTEDTYFILNISVTQAKPDITRFFAYINEIEPEYIDNNNYINKNDISSIEKIIDDNMHQYNYFDINNTMVGIYMTADGQYKSSSTGLFITNLIKVKSGDVLYCNTFNSSYSDHSFSQVLKYDENMHLLGRDSVGAAQYVANFNGYVKFNATKSNAETADDIKTNFAISKNETLTQFYPFGKYIVTNPVINTDKVKIEKINNYNYLITFGKFNVTLFKTISSSSNSNNWNIKEVKNGVNVLVPSGTDIIGPVRINENDDFIGGVHGDETTNDIIVTIDGNAYNESELFNIDTLTGDSLSITMKSTCFDQILGDSAFDRFVTLDFTPNKIHVVNSFKALKNLTLKMSTNGGLIACQAPIIKSIITNDHYFASAPTTYENNGSRYTTNATINTIYGSVTVNNIKGWENPNYNGYVHIYARENPVRSKIYFEPYKPGNYDIVTGDILSGEFEYLFS